MFSPNTPLDHLKDDYSDAREHLFAIARVITPEVLRDYDHDIHLTTTLALSNLQMEYRQHECDLNTCMPTCSLRPEKYLCVGKPQFLGVFD